MSIIVDQGQEEQGIISVKNEEKYNKARNEFRYFWDEGRRNATEADDRINTMIRILHEEQPEWSVKKIAYQIYVENEDLEGFSKNTIYRNLDEENQKLLDSSKQNRNNVLEESVPSGNTMF